MQISKTPRQIALEYLRAAASLGWICAALYSLLLAVYWPGQFLNIKATAPYVHNYLTLPFLGVELWPQVASLFGLVFPVSFALITYRRIRHVPLLRPLNQYLQISLYGCAGIAFSFCVFCFTMLFDM